MGVSSRSGDAGPTLEEYFSTQVLFYFTCVLLFKFIYLKFLMAFNLALDGCAGIHNHQPSSGKIDLELTFERATPASLNLFVMCVYESEITVDKGKVYMNYAP